MDVRGSEIFGGTRPATRRRPGRLFAASVGLALLLLIPAGARAEPPQFGIEVGLGSAVGLSPYLRNEALVRPDPSRTDPGQGGAWLVPSLADIDTGSGTGVTLRLLASNIAAGLSFQYFDLPGQRIHHRGKSAIPPSRQRADGSIDDSGVAYSLVDPAIESPIAERLRDSLIMFGLGGDYRFYWPDTTFDFFVPVGAEMVLTHVTRPASPYRLGLGVSSGVGATIHLSSGIALVLDARLHALATSHYGRREDSARRAVAVGESTEAAFFSTLIYASANLGVQFKIR